MGKILSIHGDPWAKFVVPRPADDAPREQLFEFATLNLLNSLQRADPTEMGRVMLRRTIIAHVERWHPEIEAPPL